MKMVNKVNLSSAVVKADLQGTTSRTDGATKPRPATQFFLSSCENKRKKQAGRLLSFAVANP